MACHEWKDEWIAELYGELADDEASRVAAHLAACADCARRVADLAACRRLLQAEAAALDVPAAPRLLVLGRPPRRFAARGFAAGLAAAAAVFALGLFAGVQLRPAPSPSGGAATIARESAAPAIPFDAAALEARLTGIEQRLALAGAAPTKTSALTQDQLRDELSKLEDRFDRRRAGDLDYLVRAITANEVRTGAFIDRTNEALEYLALKQDPRIRQH